MRAWQGLGVIMGVLSLGCATEIVDVKKDEEVVKVPVSFAAVEPCNEASGIRPDFFNDYWNCGQVIWIDISQLPTTPNLRGEAAAAVSAWNSALSDDGVGGVPILTTSSQTGAARVQVTLGSQGSQYCGQVLVSGVPNRINMAAGSCGTFRNVFLHELSHVVGYQDTWEKTGTAGVSNHCARFLPSGKASNSTVCQHEVESLLRHYGIGPATEVSLSKHIMTGLVGVPSSLALKIGETRTVTVTSFQFVRAHPSFGASAAPSGTMSWTETSAAFHLNGTGTFSRTVVPDQTGQGILRVRPTSTTYELAGMLNDEVTVTVNPGDPPAGAPTNLQASNITATAATISWTNGDATASTVLQYRLTGTSPWTTANGGVPLSAGTSSYRLTGLHCSTSYDVNVFHRKNGVDSPWLTLTLFTTAACTVSSTINPPSNFRQTNCALSSSGGKTYATYTVAWTAGANPSTSIFHIAESFSTTPTYLIRRGPISTITAKLGPYLVQSTSSSRYFWVRHANGAQASAWVALQGNPIAIRDGCLL
jgi:hypothetical protein